MPLRSASCIEIVIIGLLVDEFENCPNFIDAFWQFFSKKKSQAHLAQAHLELSETLLKNV